MSASASTRAVPAAASVAAALYSLCQLVRLVSAYQSGARDKLLCGDSKWSWALGSDCFRAGFLWPAELLLIVSVSFLVLAWRLLSSSSGVFSTVGNQEQPVRRPLGKAILVDNRTRIGAAALLVSIVHTALSAAWSIDEAKPSQKPGSHSELYYSAALFQSSLLVAVVSAACFAAFLRSDRLLYAGLFPWAVPALVAAQLLIGVVEIYFSFFTPQHSDEPFWGPGASARSLFLLSTTLASLVLVSLHSLVQFRPIFLRPDTGAADSAAAATTAASPSSGYSLIADESDAAQDDSIDDDSTPLAKHAGKKPTPLVDSPETSVSWFSKLSFSWPNDILRKGTIGQLDYPDLYNVTPADTPVPNWKRYLKHRKAGRSLIVTLFITFAPELTMQGILALAVCILHFTGPFFLQRILRSIEVFGSGTHPSSSEKSIRSAYLDAFGLLFFTIFASILSNQTLWIGRHIGMRLKGLLVAELSTKTLRRRGKGSWEDEKKDEDEKDEDDEDSTPTASAAADGKIMNLLTADFQRVTEVSAYLDNVYSLPLTLFIGIWYMYALLGISALVGLSLAIVYVPLSKVLFAYLTKVEEKLNALSDERVTVITELLQGIKAVKLFGWESRFLEKVDEKREKQLSYMWRLLVAWVRVMVASSLAPMLVLLVIFAVYVIAFGNKLTAEIAFTSISVFQLIRLVFEHMPGFLNWAIGGYVSLGRIDSYLGQPQVQDLEERVATASEGSDSSDGALGFVDADLEWEIAGTEDDAAKPASTASSTSEEPTKVGTPDTELQNDSQATEATPLLPSSSQVKAPLSANASYTSLSKQADMVAFSLKNINVRFPFGGLSIVAGPTGSGKSSLLSALIGEMSLVRGKILLPTINPALSVGFGDKYRDIIELSEEGLAVRDIAYVAQEAWLRNATIRENILFGEPYNEERYEEVLRVCALKPDLRILAAGDKTEIGERGVTLSGGQKQRVALARAVYSDRRILLIDDCLSAVDAHTAKHILMECLLSKTALMHGRTIVLVTHHVSMCLPYAQYVVMMREGEVTLKGNPQELQELGVFSKVLAELESTDKKDADKKEKAKGKGKGKNEATADSPASGDEDQSKSVNDTKTEDEYNLERLRKMAEQKGLDPNADLSVLEGTLVEDEERETGYVKPEVWLTFTSACGSKWFWIGSLIMLIGSQVAVVLQDYWIRIWVASTSADTATPPAGVSSFMSGAGAGADGGFLSGASGSLISGIASTLGGTHLQVPAYNAATAYLASTSAGTPGSSVAASIAMEDDAKHHSAVYWLSIYVLIGLLGIVWRMVQSIIMYAGAIKASRTLHSRLLRSVVRATPRFFDSTPLGRIINRFSRDMQTIDEWTMDTIGWWIADILAVLSVFAIITAVTPAFIFVACFVALLYAGMAYYYLTASRELKRLESNTMSPLLSLFGELILGVSSIRAFGVKKYYVKEAINRIGAHNRPFYMVWATNRWLSVRIDFAGAAVSFACAMFILFSLGWLDAGLAGFTLSYALTFSERMLWVIRNYSTNELNMNAVERVGQYLKVEQEAPLESTPENKPPPAWPQTGNIEIESLVIEYVPGVPVLHDLSLSVKHGEKIGVVGRTGAGKSTLSLAFLRFIEAAKGRITLDNVDISKIGLEDLRRNVTIIPQDPVLFNGTIRFNLDPFGEYPDELVWDALKRAHLVRERGSQSTSATTSVYEGSSEGLNDNALERMSGIFTSLDAEIKENGQNLSLGQRQLVALARALVRRSRLIIMDEATASVDFDTDDRIQRTIRGPEFADSTLFCIAHRLRTIIDYDRVLVLDKGKIAEFDTPWNLLQKDDSDSSIFKSMCLKSGEYEYLLGAAQRKSQAD